MEEEKKLLQHFENYRRRGTLSDTFWKQNEDLVKAIAEGPFADRTDIRLRGDLVHVYYRGGKILEIRPKSLKFDGKYFSGNPLRDEAMDRWVKGKKADDQGLWSLDIAKVKAEPHNYLEERTAIMDRWFLDMPKA